VLVISCKCFNVLSNKKEMNGTRTVKISLIKDVDARVKRDLCRVLRTVQGHQKAGEDCIRRMR
jgi:hypothetical protein